MRATTIRWWAKKHTEISSATEVTLTTSTMVQACVVIGCTNRWRKGSKVSWHRFPGEKDPDRRRKWLAAINRKNWQPKEGDRVCGQHFITGCTSLDPTNPDYVPSVDMGYGQHKYDGCDDHQRKMARMERACSREAKKKEGNDQMTAASALLSLSSSSFLCEPNQNYVYSETENAPPNTSIITECPRCEELKLDLKRSQAKCRELSLKLQHANTENQSLREQLNKRRFGVEWLQAGPTDTKTKFYTGLPSFAIFLWLANFIQDSLPPFSSVSKLDLLLIVLMKLRLNIQNFDIACRFNISQTTVSDILNKCIPILAENLKFLVHWPEREDVQRYLPIVFKKVYKDVRVIIDCTEIFVERPSNFTASAATYSNYKSHNTLRYLVGISPCGSVTFISKAFGGRTSDKVVTQRSGFLDMLEYGDVVLADRGFLIEEEIASRNCYLIMPSFTKGRVQLSQKDVEMSRKLARVRIHVERAIERLKNFNILSTTMQLVMVPHADSILTICSAVSNLHPSLVK